MLKVDNNIEQELMEFGLEARDPSKCYACNDRPIGICDDCPDYHCLEHSGCADEKPDEWTLCEWCWEVRYIK